ncbi:5-hydroxytryptamine receptor 4-like [Saccoglossus kowalevskii]|uniref:Octopamine receptor 1-like n=1 Tax=Saccoglossus kowalevskii TaxID=10224 RepID=A0ABM0GNS0_SACKO|nr:PREDICTED: octopamine receptor 1-like [Saccoglossus kowalevskii]
MNVTKTFTAWHPENFVNNGSNWTNDERDKYSTLDCDSLMTLFYTELGVLAFLGIPVVIGNTLVILAVYQNHNLRTPPNYFIVSLAFADLMIGVTMAAQNVLLHGQGVITHKWACVVISVIAYNPIGASLSHLLAIGIDRYIAILHPLRYHQLITVSRVKVVIVIIWVYCFVTIAPIWFMTDSKANSCYELMIPIIRGPGIFITIVAFVVPLIIMVAIYARIFVIARHHLRRINPQSEDTQQQHYMKREVKAAITPCVVIGVMLFCWVPQFIVVVMDRYEVCANPQRFVSNLFMLINSGANPLIYARHNTEFRQAFRKSIQKIKASLC